MHRAPATLHPCLGHTLLIRAEKRSQEEPLIKCKVTMGHRDKKGTDRKITGPLLRGTNLRQWHPRGTTSSGPYTWSLGASFWTG